VTGPAQLGARAALDAVRATLARLEPPPSSEDLAADLIEIYEAIEGALRSLVGSAVLSGQPLIREARQRQIINFDQANALADFQATRDRVQDTSYQPVEADLNTARVAFAKLDAGLSSDGGFTAGPPRMEQPPAIASVPMVESAVVSSGPPRRFPRWAIAANVVGLLAVVAIAAYFALRPAAKSSLQQGVDLYRAGQREAAVSAFNKAVREDPKAPLPHVYLARMAREVGNFTVANQELQLALQADPSNEIAMREMGANLFAQGNYELARRFYVRAVQADTADKSALGYLGCTLAKLGRAAEATSFLNRAGSGPWSACAGTGAVTP
jgi:tetratricopeptide (TPR) repeat protein